MRRSIPPAAPRRAVLTALAALLAAPSGAQEVARPAAAERPTLLVFLTVDQLRSDYLTRFEPQLTGGLARLVRGGAFFTQAYQDHAITQTAPGHAATLSGRYPRSTGIVRNSEGVQDPASPLLGTDGEPASPARFRGTTLVDWLQATDRRTRVLSVSRKDRGAIFPVGRGKHQVYWYAPTTGIFTTSRWYASELPEWVRRFNARRLPHRLAGRAWRPLLEESAYPEPDSVPAENHGRGVVFPHVVAADTAVAVADVTNFPWIDDITLDLALEGVRALGLGRGPQTDVLAISLSATDAIGHRYGPDSREVHDQVLRVDRALGAFFDSLHAIRDSARVVVALTGDHGVSTNPASRAGNGDGASLFVPLRDTVVATFRRIAAAGVSLDALDFEFPLFAVNREAFRARRLSVDSVVASFAASLRAMPGVVWAETPAQLARRDTATDTLARRWQRALPPDHPTVLTITLAPDAYWSRGDVGEHGDPYDLHAHVPLIFLGAPFKPGRYEERAAVVDLAPTLAAALGVRPRERVDGRVLRAAIR